MTGKMKGRRAMLMGKNEVVMAPIRLSKLELFFRLMTVSLFR